MKPSDRLRRLATQTLLDPLIVVIAMAAVARFVVPPLLAWFNAATDF